MTDKNNRELEREYVCPILDTEFVLVPGGEFEMGDVWGEGAGNEKPVHTVAVPSFYMSKYPLTQGECLDILGEIEDLPLELMGCDWDVPRNFASWDLVQELIALLNGQSEHNYRLPSEAEWEYAARSGGKQIRYSGTDLEGELPNFAIFGLEENLGGHSEVGQKQPNAFGLYDMGGNVWEWCQDGWHDDYYGAPTDGSAWEEGGDPDRRVIRGGAYSSPAWQCRVSHRSWCRRVDGHRQVGIRLCVEIS